MRIFKLVYIAVMISLVALCSCNHKQKQENVINKIQVKTDIIIEKEFVIPIRCSGILSSKSEVKLSFKTGGIINRILVDEGQIVKKGQLLAQLNLSEIEARVNQAKLAYEKSVRDLERAQNLFKDSVITKELLQNATTAKEIAESDLQVAEFNLKYSTITAPSNGKILKRMYENNEIVGPGYPVIMFGSTEQNWVVRVNVTDKDIAKLLLNDSATVMFDTYNNVRLRAFVTETGSAADPYTGTYEVELMLDKTDRNLVSGFIAKANIYPSGTKLYRAVPINALVDGQEEYGFIYKIADSSFQKTKVRFEKITDDYLLVTIGIEPGDEVIVEGADYVTKGCEIEIIE